MVEYNKMFMVVLQVLLVAGAINWGTVALMDLDLVTEFVGDSDIERYIKLAIGAAGVYYAYTLYQWKSNSKKLDLGLKENK